ncbi:MAG TPA: hypothetical protein VH600_14595 [Burkholderiales bacterium]|jgi:hypothetical protein
MKRYVMYVGILLLAGTLVSCGGGGGGGDGGGTTAGNATPPSNGGTPPPNTPPSNGGTPPNNGGGTVSSATQRFEENDTSAVTQSGSWDQGDTHGGWSGGNAVQSNVAQASVTFSFNGTSARWIGGRGRNGGLADVLVDGAKVKTVNLFYRPNDEFGTPCFTVYGLTPGPHTLTIVATGTHDPDAAADSTSTVWVDAFEVNPLVVSRLQDSDPAVKYSDGWALAPEGFKWSGGGASNDGEPPVRAMVTATAGATATLQDNDRNLNVRGTSISWVGYRGPDAGIAAVSVDGGPEVRVDTYAADFKVQEVLFTASGLEDKPHVLTIRATGEKNIQSTAANIFVDAFDVAKPGQRIEEDSPQVSFAAPPGSPWQFRNSRDWSEGWARTHSVPGTTATFTFTGTSVSWIACEKSTIGSARVFVDDQPPVDVDMNKPLANAQGFAVQGFQRTVFRKDGLAPGPHTLRIEVTSNNSNFVVVDAFDIVQ